MPNCKTIATVSYTHLTFRIKEYINKNHPKSAVLAGGGFIGLELAENLRELGMDVTTVSYTHLGYIVL